MRRRFFDCTKNPTFLFIFNCCTLRSVIYLRRFETIYLWLIIDIIKVYPLNASTRSSYDCWLLFPNSRNSKLIITTSIKISKTTLYTIITIFFIFLTRKETKYVISNSFNAAFSSSLTSCLTYIISKYILFTISSVKYWLAKQSSAWTTSTYVVISVGTLINLI